MCGEKVQLFVITKCFRPSANENTNGPITVIARGGDELRVGFEKIGNQFRNVTLTGPAEFVFEGTVEI